MVAARSHPAPSRRHRLNRLNRLVAGIALLALWSACEAPPERRSRFVDWVTDGGIRSNMGQPEPASAAVCADENRFSRQIRDGEEFTVGGFLGEAGRLVLTTCATRSTFSAHQTGTLRLEAFATSKVEAGGSNWPQPVVRELRVPVFSRWSTVEVNLAGLANRQVTLRMRANLPPGRNLFLQDFFVEHLPVVAQRRQASRPNAPPQGLLISVDTLREDAISVLGGSHATPGMDAFARDAQVFSPHYSAAAWTQPSHAAMLTGQPHLVHGANNGKRAIHPAVATLAERFQAQGFATAGLVFDCLWLDSRFGFGRGFDQYRSVEWTLPQSVRQTLNWVDDHRDKPFFYFLHTFEAHSDYRRMPYEGPGNRPARVADLFGLEDYGCREGYCSSALLGEINLGNVALLPGEEEVLRYLYDQGVAHLDQQLAVLFEGLAQRGLFDNMLIVLTSDHGESFEEHGQLLHGHPWQEELRVPLVIKWPGGVRAGETVAVPSSSLDLVPTLLRHFGMETTGLPGGDLLHLRADRPIFSGANFDAVIAGRWKAVWGRLEGERWLFDLETDPGEHHNLADERPEELQRLAEILQQRQADEKRWASQLGQGADGTQQLSEEERARLRALGYLGD